MKNPFHKDPAAIYIQQSTFGERVSDQLANIGGSWPFIIGFAIVLVIWICINSYIFVSKPFDPYPFILLNLVLSCLAAIQAPVIMMSQNRQEAKDRLRAEADYETNVNAGAELRALHIEHTELHRKLERLIEQVEIFLQQKST